MTVNPAVLRLAGALVPCSFLLHEGVYAVAGGAESSGAHGYLAYAVPVGATAAMALIAAGLMLPVLGCQERGIADRRAPFALAGALVATFLVQEVVETLFLGDGDAALTAALTAVWLAIPLSLTLGLLAASLIGWLDRAAWALITSDRFHATAEVVKARHSPASVSPKRLSPLAFGLACRPPPGR